jgi:hypothetical protein
MIPNTFQVLEKDGEQLILPEIGVGNHSWQDWNHRWLRSMHVGPDQRIISTGLPKFMNLGEGCDRYHVDEDDVLKRAGKDLRATLKIDGSLLIRYVQDGQVKFRTRGSFGVHLDNAFEIDEFKKQYPLLGDPSYRPDDSLLFEWVSPFLTIVIRYDQPQIFLIGAVRYHKDRVWYNADPKLYTLEELNVVSEEMGIPLTDFYPLKTPDEVSKLIKNLESEKSIEGFVLRWNNDQEMVKVKASHFLILHALKSNLTTAKLVELWQSWEEPEFNDFAERFQAAYDFECWVWAMPVASSMFDGIYTARKIVAHVREFVEARRGLGRKEFALESQSRFNQLRLSLCFILWDHKPVDKELMKKLILQNCKQVERRMFSDDA